LAILTIQPSNGMAVTGIQTFQPDYPRFSRRSQSYNRTYDEWVPAAGVPYKQTDFGGHVAQVTRSQILEFIASSYRTSATLTTNPVIDVLLTYQAAEILRSFIFKKIPTS